MLFYIDLDLLEVIETATDQRRVAQREIQRGDNTPFEVRFVRGGIQEALPTGTILTFCAKADLKFDGPAIILQTAFVLTGAGVTAAYVASVAADTAPLNALLNVDAIDTNDLPLIDLMGEFSWQLLPAKPTSARRFKTRVNNDVYKGDETFPSTLPGPDDFVLARAVLYDRTQTLTAPQKAVALGNIGGARGIETRSAAFTAVVGGRYQTRLGGIFAITDPTVPAPVDGQSYEVWIGTGSAITFAGSATVYHPSRFSIRRLFNGTAWTTPTPKITDALEVGIGVGSWTGDTFAGPQTFSGLQRLAGQNVTPATSDESMTYRQVGNAIAQVDRAALLDWQLNGWSGTGVVPSKGACAGDMLLVGAMSPVIEGTTGFGRQLSFDGINDAGVVTKSDLTKRLHDGKDFTLLLEGERLGDSSVAAFQYVLASGSTSNNTNDGILLLVEGASFNGSIKKSNGTLPASFGGAYTGTLVAICISRSGAAITTRLKNSVGTVFNYVSVGNVANDVVSTYDLILCGNPAVVSNSNPAKINRIRIWDVAITAATLIP